jgi:hypothetical protein
VNGDWTVGGQSNRRTGNLCDVGFEICIAQWLLLGLSQIDREIGGWQKRAEERRVMHTEFVVGN